MEPGSYSRMKPRSAKLHSISRSPQPLNNVMQVYHTKQQTVKQSVHKTLFGQIIFDNHEEFCPLKNVLLSVQN